MGWEGILKCNARAHAFGRVFIRSPQAPDLSSVIISFLAERGWDRSVVLTFISLTIGTLTIYLFGVLWLAYLKDLNTAIVFGLLPFITPNLLKICLGTCMVSAGWEIKDKFLNK